MRILPQSPIIPGILILATQLVVFVTGCDSNPFDNKRFDQKVWFANPVTSDKNNNLRLEMSEDLTKNHLKVGMTRQQTRKLLGKPDFLDSYCPGKNGCDDYLLRVFHEINDPEIVIASETECSVKPSA